MKGFSCWQFHAPGGYGCRHHIECGEVSIEEAENIAGRAGWMMGHFDGQAHYSCPDCAPSLFDTFLLGTEAGRAVLSAPEGREGR